MAKKKKTAKKKPAKNLMQDQVKEIKDGLDQLLAAYERKDEKRTFYWTALVTRGLATLSRTCLGLEPLKDEGGLALPEEKKIIIA